MNPPPAYDELLARLQPFGQSHVLSFWNELNPAEQQQLASQLGSIDLALVESLATSHAEGESWDSVAARAEPPPAVTLEQFYDPGQYQKAYDRGAEAIATGKVAMILTAGGQGSRLGFDHPKGMYPIGPVSGRTLYQVILEKVLARSRQFQGTIPMHIHTFYSPKIDSLHFFYRIVKIVDF